MEPLKKREGSFVALILLGMAGMVLGGILTVEHVHLKISGVGNAICEQFSETGCLVTIGRFGALFGGRIPVSVIGFGGAFSICALAVLAYVRRRNERDALRSILFMLTTISVLVSALMAFLSVVENAFCPFCIAWYGVNAAGWVAAILALDRSWTDAVKTALRQIPKQMGAVSLGMFVLAVGVGWLAYDFGYQHELAKAGWEQDERILGADPGEHPDVAAYLKGAIDSKYQKVIPDIVSPAVHSVGKGEKVLRVVEFTDLECPYCQKLWVELKKVVEDSPYRVELTLVHFPLTFHEYARGAAHAAECARLQDKSWEYVDTLFAHNDALKRKDLLSYAETIVGDMEWFEACLDDPITEARIAADQGLGKKIGLTGTPALIINGYRFEGVRDAETLRKIFHIIAAR